MKVKSKFVCRECGYTTAKWMGKCPGCEAWNSLDEEQYSKSSEARKQQGFTTLSSGGTPVELDDISLTEIPRYQTNISEFDRVLGGGIVPASLILLGGDPGIGKSTLILETLNNLALHNHSVLYVTGEESKEQIKMRAERLGVKANLLIMAENDLDKILKQADKLKPQVMVVDSIQTVFLPHLESAPGSVSQVRECTAKILYFSKSSLTSSILIGHVTKEGSLAGPRVLEHMVDTVLYFEGENTQQFRVLRTIKNRYGSTNEIGVFEMTSGGLSEVMNPSEHFLKGKQEQSSGSCVTACIEGTRPILTEIQSLVTHSHLNNPRRTCIGIDSNRLSLILAVLEKCTGLKFFDQDVYVNVAGGLKITEPASDLAIAVSLLSSLKNQTVPAELMAFGEIGLNGEIRPVSQTDSRLSESTKLGYSKILIPFRSKFDKNPNNIEMLKIKHIQDLENMLF